MADMNPRRTPSRGVRQTPNASETDMQCWIYKGSRRAETYLYLREGGDTSDVPPALLEAMGPLELVMELTLSPQRTLARASAEQVMRDLEKNGYYLQMPPAKDKQPELMQ